MPTFLDSVACLTELRDTNNLEVGFASVVFDHARATRVSLWRWVDRDGVVTIDEHLSLCAAGKSGSTTIPDLPLASARADLTDALKNRQPTRSRPSDTGLWSHLFPTTDDRAAGLVLEILRVSPLDVEEEHSILVLLRIYCNLSGNIDHSERDELTGLLNRRTFDQSFTAILTPDPVVPDKIVRADRRRFGDREPSHLAVIDIDFFKRVNDRFGHLYGDEVLVLLARLMTQSFRETDGLFRFGGEEFVVILRGTTADEATMILERFRGLVERFTFPQVGTVTVSIGFSMIVAGDTGSNAFGRADEALYVAKQQGRNQARSHEALIADGILAHRIPSLETIELF